jgi:hypothetical protein
MSAIEKIKAASKLALKRDLAIGIEQLDKGHCEIYNEQNLFQLTKDIISSGRRRLKRIK